MCLPPTSQPRLSFADWIVPGLLLSNLKHNVMEEKEKTVVVMNSWSLDQFKAARGIKTIDVFTSRKTSKKYAVRHDTNEFIGMLAADLDKTKPVGVLQMKDNESGETWLFVCNYEPRVAEDTL